MRVANFYVHYHGIDTLKIAVKSCFVCISGRYVTFGTVVLVKCIFYRMTTFCAYVFMQFSLSSCSFCYAVICIASLALEQCKPC